jgi:hypothetical protein
MANLKDVTILGTAFANSTLHIKSTAQANNVTGTVSSLTPGTSGNVLTSDGTNWISQAGSSTFTGDLKFLGTVGQGTNMPASGTSSLGQYTYKVPLDSGIATSSGSFNHFLIIVSGIDTFYSGYLMGMQWYVSGENSGTTPVSSKISFTSYARRGDGTTIHHYGDASTDITLNGWSAGGMSSHSIGTYMHKHLQFHIHVMNPTDGRTYPRCSWQGWGSHGAMDATPSAQYYAGAATLAGGTGSTYYAQTLKDILLCSTSGFSDRRYTTNQHTATVRLYGIT